MNFTLAPSSENNQQPLEQETLRGHYLGQENEETEIELTVNAEEDSEKALFSGKEIKGKKVKRSFTVEKVD